MGYASIREKGMIMGQARRGKCLYLVKYVYFLLKHVITNSFFSSSPPDSQSLPQNAQSTLLLPEKHFSSEKYQNDLIAVLFLMHHSTRWYGLLII